MRHAVQAVPSVPTVQKARGYQVHQVDAVMDAMADGIISMVYSGATGTGKTWVIAELTRRFLMRDGGTWNILITADKDEIIRQTVKVIMNHCNLREWEVGTEMDTFHATGNERVIVGCVPSCIRPNRPVNSWQPNVIIVDEAHHASCASHRKIADRYGVNQGKCFYIGCTATPVRFDKVSVYAENPDGSPTLIEEKKKPPRPATPADSVFHRLVYDYPIDRAIPDGYLLDAKIIRVETSTDISKVGRTKDGEFKENELGRAVDNATRTMEAINVWKQAECDNEQTLVFCATVEHAIHSAELFNVAGYAAEVVYGRTDKIVRYDAKANFLSGKTQVLCNVGVYTEGTNLPNCRCVIMLRPCRSFPLYQQMAGRVLRPTDGLLDEMTAAFPEERLAAIAADVKPFAYIFDVVDICETAKICTGMALLKVPTDMDLEGHTMTEGKKVSDEYEKVKEYSIAPCPIAYSEYQVQAAEIGTLLNSGARTVQKWRYTDTGYRYVGIPPGYQCDLRENSDGKFWLRVKGPQGVELIRRSTGMPNDEQGRKLALDHAVQDARAAIDAHKATCPKPPKPSLGTLAWMREKTPGWLRMMKRANFQESTIDAMTKKQVVTIAQKLADEHFGRK